MLLTRGFRYEFTFSELRYLLLGKKKCPHCGGSLRQEKDFAIVEGSQFNRMANPTFASGAEVKYYRYLFRCNRCGTSYPLSQLAGKQKGRS